MTRCTFCNGPVAKSFVALRVPDGVDWSPMSIEILLRDHPALTLVTLAGGVAYATSFRSTLRALKYGGKDPGRPKGTLSGLAWDRPVLAAACVLGAAALVDHLVRRDRRSTTFTGAARAPAYRRQTPPASHSLPAQPRPPQQQPGGGRPGGGAHPPVVSPYGTAQAHAPAMHGMPASSSPYQAHTTPAWASAMPQSTPYYHPG